MASVFFSLVEPLWRVVTRRLRLEVDAFVKKATSHVRPLAYS
jgi:hypothetical protein